VGNAYDVPVNRASAYEILNRRTITERAVADSESKQPAAEKSSEGGGLVSEILWGTTRRQGLVETLAKQAARTVGSQIGRQILRGVLGGILGGSSRR
jgi:hypothetical protein